MALPFLPSREEARLLPTRPPWLLGALAAILIALAVLALGLAAAAHRAAGAWGGAVAATATLSIIAEEAEIEAEARAALDILRETPGIRSIRVLDPAEQRALLAPWLGTGIAFDSLALPLMIEVRTDRAVLDRATLDARLAQEAPAAIFDDHSAWRQSHREAASQLRLGAGGAAVALLAALAGAAALAARAAAAAAAPTLAMLIALGMRDRMLVRAVIARPMAMLWAGGFAGMVLATLLVGQLDPGAASTGYAAGFWGWTWLLPPLALLVGIALALAAAWVAAVRSLRARP